MTALEAAAFDATNSRDPKSTLLRDLARFQHTYDPSPFAPKLYYRQTRIFNRPPIEMVQSILEKMCRLKYPIYPAGGESCGTVIGDDDENFDEDERGAHVGQLRHDVHYYANCWPAIPPELFNTWYPHFCIVETVNALRSRNAVLPPPRRSPMPMKDGMPRML
jgi:hypothetical protein